MTAKRHTITLTQEVTVEQVIDLVVYFNGLDDDQRNDYMALDPDDRSVFIDGPEEWRWPLVYLVPPDAGAQIDPDIVLVPHASVVRDDVTEDGVDARVYSRPFDVPDTERGRPGEWTVADFNHLRTAVKWLDDFHYAREVGVEEEAEDLVSSRVPGPNDLPMF